VAEEGKESISSAEGLVGGSMKDSLVLSDMVAVEVGRLEEMCEGEGYRGCIGVCGFGGCTKFSQPSGRVKAAINPNRRSLTRIPV